MLTIFAYFRAKTGPEIHQDFFPWAAEEPKHAVGHAYSTKWGKYGETCEAEGLCFIPLPVE